MMPTPPLGYITPSQRNQAQADAHEEAMKRAGQFAMPAYADPPRGTKVLLTDFWKDPLVVQDIGREFTGFGQYTGSCVGVATGDCVFTLSGVQRRISTNPTRAFVPWWAFDYGRCRLKGGDRGPGEGAMTSVSGMTVKDEGVLPWDPSLLPHWTENGGGLWLSKSIEMEWSDGGRIDQKWRDMARQFPVGTIAQLHSAVDVRAAILNGYPVLTGCDEYVGTGHIKGEGADAYVVGRHDGRGGHATGFLGVWYHPNDGWLYEYSNQWQTGTYPKDPAGAGRCCVWLPESEVDKRFRLGADGETMALSHLNYFPAQPEVLTYVP